VQKFSPAALGRTVGEYFPIFTIPQAIRISGKIEEHTPISRGRYLQGNGKIERVFHIPDRLSTVFRKLSTENREMVPRGEIDRFGHIGVKRA
jgi:hypothetical protein